jgi:hypothetical protein
MKQQELLALLCTCCVVCICKKVRKQHWKQVKVNEPDVNNKKFWEELICLLSQQSHLFEVLEPDLMKLNLSELSNFIQFNLI